MLLSILGLGYGRYLLLSYALFEERKVTPDPALLFDLVLQHPGRLLGVWMLLFTVVGAYAGWRYSQDPSQE